MVFLSLDLSITSTGAVSGNNETFESRVFKSKKLGPSVHDRFNRFAALSQAIADYAYQVQPDIILIEGPANNYRGNAIYLPEFCGIVKHELTKLCPTIHEIPPTTIKKWTTGKGRADKKQMAKAIYERWGVKFKTDDEADAFALFKYGLELCGTNSM